MPSQSASYLGILDLEREPGAVRPTPQPGSLMSPATYNFPVITETVKGALAEVVMRGSPALEPAYIAAAQRLVERGAVIVSSNCGFAVRHQAAVAAAVNVPVVMSALIMAPALLRQLPPAAQLAIVTSDSRLFTEDLLGIAAPAERARIVVGGTEGGNMWRNAAMIPPQPIDVADIEEDLAVCVRRLRADNPRIAALLFTCTGFPMATPAIRRMTGLPIYDITTACRVTLESIMSTGLVHASH
ncbi:hypothetical protein SAMN05216330_1348 [Bradyrhizobium sp. Ghvi]|uniref:hypothetical protein n=1 Tax=Bradyrhizobium sp. Ghvi TaxID=1855319 RepID=UPI0008EC0C00|nr:hypothetical protein [Bradyrhizobium sp. Ghvi]SFQ36667.1 hypothetical protein SAMN05216330_1348 [Bradyrhizobium sp. Ghvi]